MPVDGVIVKGRSSLDQSMLTGEATPIHRGRTTMIWDPGTTFAYAMHKVGKWNKDKTRIEELEIDAKGMN